MKYQRTFHLPFSPGATSDDKIIDSIAPFLNKDVVITEKLDGSNSCLNQEGVFARSHAVKARHASFNRLKQLHQSIYTMINPQENLFGENCFAVHSIAYDLLSTYFYLFSIYQEDTDTWSSWKEVESRAKELGMETAPVLGYFNFKNEKELKSTVEKLCSEPSVFGGEREGIVLRVTNSFKTESFPESVCKWVRKDHVQTDEHWLLKPIIPQKIKK